MSSKLYCFTFRLIVIVIYTVYIEAIASLERVATYELTILDNNNTYLPVTCVLIQVSLTLICSALIIHWGLEIKQKNVYRQQ